MKKIILSVFLIFFAMLFAQENILLKSDAQAELNGYDYVKNFTVNSTSGYFTKDSFKILEPNEKGFRVCVEVPNTSTSYDILPSYPSFLNEANIGAGYIENAGSIKKIDITLTLNRPYDEIIFMYSTSPNGDIKFFKMPQNFNSVKSMEETVLTIEPDSYIQDVNYRDIKSAVALGGENDGIYFRGIRVKVNKAPNNIDFSPYSIVYLKEIKVQYDLNLTPEQFEQRKAMKEEWGISDEEELIREKTIARIDIEVKNKEQEKSKMFKEEVSE